MRKLLLALLMLAIIVGVSYLKAKHGSAMDGGTASFDAQSNAEELWAYEQAVDSLKYLMSQEQLKHEKALQRNRMETQHLIDSLVRVLEESEQAGGRPEATDSAPTSDELVRNQQILDHYRKLYRALPKDLSAYERRVALYEIRLKTAEKFKITFDELKQIRSEAGLSY